jgi:lipoprotein Spr
MKEEEKIKSHQSKVLDRKSKIEYHRSKVECRKSKIFDQKSKIEYHRSKIECHRFEVENQKSKIKSQKPSTSVFRLIAIAVAALTLMSCSTRRRYAANESAAAAKLSKQYGMQLTAKDNIPLYDACSRWFGVKYRAGGTTVNGVDCSGFVSAIYRQVYRADLERTVSNILRRNCTSIRRSSLREGDLVFFKTTGAANSKIPTHVGIYLKNGRFVHASTSKGVIVSNLSEPYYVRTWITGGHVRKR